MGVFTITPGQQEIMKGSESKPSHKKCAPESFGGLARTEFSGLRRCRRRRRWRRRCRRRRWRQTQ